MSEVVEKQLGESELDAKRWLALGPVLCGTFLAVLDFLIVNLALPIIQRDMKASDAQLQLTVATYGLAYAVCLITGGRLGDIYGRKRVFMIGMAGFVLASLACGWAQNPMQLITFRVVQGMVAALMSPQVLSIIQVSFEGREKRLAFALLGAVVGSGSFVGNVLGGWLVGANLGGLSWRPVFWVNIPIGALALLAAWAWVRESRVESARKLDVPGVILLSGALFGFIFPLAEGREAGWPLWAWGSLALSGILFWIWLRFEQSLSARGGSPLVELALFHDRVFTMGLTGIIGLFCAIGSFPLALTLFLQDGLGLSPARTGWIFAPLALGFLGASLWAVRLQQLLGNRVLMLGLGLMLSAQIALMTILSLQGARLGLWELLPILFFYGGGQGMTVPSLMSTILGGVSNRNAGSAAGVLQTTQQIALSLGVAIIGGLYFSSLGRNPNADSFAHALLIAVACNFVLMLVTLWLVSRLPHTVPNPAIEVPIEA